MIYFIALRKCVYWFELASHVRDVAHVPRFTNTGYLLKDYININHEVISSIANSNTSPFARLVHLEHVYTLSSVTASFSWERSKERVNIKLHFIPKKIPDTYTETWLYLMPLSFIIVIKGYQTTKIKTVFLSLLYSTCNKWIQKIASQIKICLICSYRPLTLSILN